MCLTFSYFDSTFMLTIHLLMLNILFDSSINVNNKNKIIVFYCYLAIYYIIMNAEVCIIRGYLCHNIKQAMSYHIMKFYVMTCCMLQLLQHPYNPLCMCSGSYIHITLRASKGAIAIVS